MCVRILDDKVIGGDGARPAVVRLHTPHKQSIERRMNFVISSFEDYRLNKNLKENDATWAYTSVETQTNPGWQHGSRRHF